MESRELLSLAVIGAFSLSLAATSKPPEGGASGDAGFNIDGAYAAVVGAAAQPAPAVTCTDVLLTTTAKTVKTAESWEKPDLHDVMLIDAPVAAGMSKTAPRQNHPDDGWRWINSQAIRDLYPISWTVTEQSESNNIAKIRSVAARPLFVVLKADARVLPKVTTGDNYVGGKLAGKLVFARIDTGGTVCAVPFSAESSPSVKFKTRGITGTSLERAILDDFKDQVRASIRTAATTIGPAWKIDVGL